MNNAQQQSNNKKEMMSFGFLAVTVKRELYRREVYLWVLKVKILAHGLSV